MTIQPGGELEIRKYWDADYPDKVSTLSWDSIIDI